MLEIFTDGSCSPNPGRGGWAFVVIQDGRCIKERFGGEPDTTNNRMEITAIIQALFGLPPGTTATIVSDSKLCVEILSGRWRAKANRDLIDEARELMRERRIKFRWVRGHNGNRWNERADALAARGMGCPKRRRGKISSRKPKTPNNGDLRARAKRDGLSFGDTLPPWLVP